MASTDDLPSLLQLIDVQPNDRILEMECGDGVLTVAMAARAASGLVLALDWSEERVHEARARGRDRDNVMFVHGGAGEIPWQADYFSKALSHGWPGQLADVFRVLAPGGVLYAVLPADDAPVQNTKWTELERAGFVGAGTVVVNGAQVATARKPG